MVEEALIGTLPLIGRGTTWPPGSQGESRAPRTKETGKQEVSEDVLLRLNNSYAEVITCQHALAGVGRAVRLQLHTWEFSELTAMILRTLGQGTKVCAEITLMAADTGKISMKNDIIAAGGSGHGLDTAWIIKPVHSHQFFDLRLKAIIAKPLNF